MKTSITVKDYVKGFAAGLLALFTLVVAIYLLLAVAGAINLIQEVIAADVADEQLGEGSTLSMVAGSIASIATNFVRGIWAIRGGFIVAGALGLLGVFGLHLGRATYRRYAWQFSFAAVATVITVSLVTWAIGQQAAVSEWLAERPELYMSREMFERSFWTDFWVGLIVGVMLSLPIWALWRNWYERLQSRKDGDLSAAESNTEQSAISEHRAYAERLQALKRVSEEDESAARSTPDATPQVTLRLLTTLALLLVLALAISFWAIQSYDSNRLQLEHATVRTAEDAPEFSAELELRPNTRRLRIANINGAGTVDIDLQPKDAPQNENPAIQDWTFQQRDDPEYLHQEILVAGEQPGPYSLYFDQKAGWGIYEYTLSHGGEGSSTLALIAGFAMACSLLLALALGLLVLLRLGWLHTPTYGEGRES